MDKKVGVYGGKFNILHNGHMSALLKAYSSCDELFVFVMEDVEFEKERYASHNLDYIPAWKRVRWFTEELKGLENIHVTFIEHKNTDNIEDWRLGGQLMIDYIGKHSKYCKDGKFDIMFSTEPSYDKTFKNLYPFAEHIIFEKEFGLSATRILNEGIFNHLDNVPKSVKRDFIKKIVILGGESSGKSTLTVKLAKYFNTEYISEYGRTHWGFYNGGLGKVFDEEDYKYLTYKQKTLEFEILDKCNKYLFVDTETIVTETWLNQYEQINNKVLSEISKSEDYSLYILLTPDLEFHQDGTRNFGEESKRIEIFNEMKNKLEKYNKNYKIVSGNTYDKFNKSIEIVKALD